MGVTVETLQSNKLRQIEGHTCYNSPSLMVRSVLRVCCGKDRFWLRNLERSVPTVACVVHPNDGRNTLFTCFFYFCFNLFGVIIVFLD